MGTSLSGKKVAVLGAGKMGGILLQALLVGLVGYGAGAGLGGIFGLIAGGQDSKIAFATPWPMVVISFVAVIAICLLSALISIRKVVKLEPAVVFRG